jgi:hypothetical protein
MHLAQEINKLAHFNLILFQRIDYLYNFDWFIR